MASPVFLSYAWDKSDLDEADRLDTALRLRGVPIWRDRRDMSFGSYNESRVREAIRDQCSGFVLYYTDAVLSSDFILKVELPEMDARRRRGAPPSFFAGAVFRRSLGIHEAADELRQASGVSLGEALGAPVSSEDFDADLRNAANAISGAYLAGELSGDEVTIRVETRGPLPNNDPAALHLCWCPPLHHDPDQLSPEAWTRDLLPALADVHRSLQEVGAPRRLRIGGNLHLSAALAIGWQFRQPTGYIVAVDHPDVPAETALTTPDTHGWRLVVQPGPTDGEERLVVCVHATKDVTQAMDAHARELPPARATLHVYPPDGTPGRQSVKPTEANSLAAAIAAEIDRCRNTYRTDQTHLYLACPWPLAMLLGWHLSSSGRLVMHEPDVERGNYRAACELA